MEHTFHDLVQKRSHTDTALSKLILIIFTHCKSFCTIPFPLMSLSHNWSHCFRYSKRAWDRFFVTIRARSPIKL